MVYTVTKGFDLEWILQLDLLCFRSLVASIKRIETEERISSTWMNYVSSQGDHKNVESYVRSLRSELGEDNSEELAKKLREHR